MKEKQTQNEERKKPVLLTVLGTTPYQEVEYVFENKTYRNKYIQCVVFQHLREAYDLPDLNVKIFLTKDARQKNWEIPGGLKEGLWKFLPTGEEYKFLEEKDIKDGNDEEELWEIFNVFYDSIERDTEIYVDITHSFRSLPIILLSVLDLAKKAKNISVGGIYYGTFTLNRPPEEPEKVISLSVYNQVTEWSDAIGRFLRTGNAKDLHQNLEPGVKRIKKAIHSKGSIQEKDSNYKDFVDKISGLNKNLKKFSEDLMTVRGMTVNESALKVKESIEELKTIRGKVDVSQVNRYNILPFYKVIDQMDKLFQKISPEKSDIEITNEIVHLCLDFGLIQQGFTFLEENTTSYLCSHASGIIRYVSSKNGEEEIKEIDLNCYWKGEEKREISWSKLDRDNKNISEMREQISAVFYNIVNNNKEKESSQSFEELMVTLPKEKERDIAAIRKNIKNARNDLNHAGFRLGSRDEDTLKKELMRELEKFEKII